MAPYKDGMAKHEHDGYFTPEDAIWRVGREVALLLGGGRALLLQVAHPLVAAGVAEHSSYRENPWQRLEGTLNAVWSVVYGRRREADRAAARVRAMHARVEGRLAEPAGPFPKGTRYSALDPALLMWVHATLVDTALLVHDRWVRPLDASARSAYFEDMKVCARLFGTPEDVMPGSYEEFRSYMDRMLDGDELCVTPTARDIARTVLRPPLPLALRPAMEVVNVVTASLMPPRLRRDYGLSWDAPRAAVTRVSQEWVRRVAMPLLPGRLRHVPASG